MNLVVPSPYDTEPYNNNNLIQNDLKIHITNIRFHAVHRVGKPAVGKTRPIMARFVCREDRDLIWSRKKDLKNSTTYQDAYITQDYAKAIQQERRTLIKAMKKARAFGFDSKVIDRTIAFINKKSIAQFHIYSI